MIARTALTLSALVSIALAISTEYLLLREDAPTDEDLLASCPGGPGSDNIKRADRCTLINIVNNPDKRVFSVLGDPQLNCGGGSEDITVTLGGSTTITQTTTANANLGFSLDGLTIGGGLSVSDSTATTESKTVEYSIPPGRQAVYVAGVNQKSQSGNVQVNYGSRQFDHFIWFTGATITQLTPVPDDINFDVYESACGTDPRDLSSLQG